MLELMAQFLPELFAGFRQDLDRPALGDMQNRIGEALGRLDRMAAEATHERITRLGAEPDQRPLLRTMLRLRHDLVMIGRAGMAPLPEPFRSRLGAYLARVSETAADYLRASATVLLARQGSPSLDPVESALDGHAAEFAALRREGFTRRLSDEAVERIFALGFALDQLRLHLRDLARCVAELAPTRSVAVRDLAASSGGARQ
jgi:ribosomal protein S18 acetylase RimI-like enzyme